MKGVFKGMKIPYSQGKAHNFCSRMFPPRYHNYVYFWERHPPTVQKKPLPETPKTEEKKELFDEEEILVEEIKIREELEQEKDKENKKFVPGDYLHKGNSQQVILQQWKETEIILSFN